MLLSASDFWVSVGKREGAGEGKVQAYTILTDQKHLLLCHLCLKVSVRLEHRQRSRRVNKVLINSWKIGGRDTAGIVYTI